MDAVLGRLTEAAPEPDQSMARKFDDRGIIIEFLPSGNYVKVSAFDPVTMTEVSIVGDPARGEAGLRQAVLRKLKYVLEKNAPSQKPGRGRLV